MKKVKVKRVKKVKKVKKVTKVKKVKKVKTVKHKTKQAKQAKAASFTLGVGQLGAQLSLALQHKCGLQRTSVARAQQTKLFEATVRGGEVGRPT